MHSYVADTHSLIWRLTDSPKLGAAASQIFDRVDSGSAKLIIPVIAIAELMFAIQKHKLPLDMLSVINLWHANPVIEIAELRLNVVMMLPSLTMIPEMHDRLIACEALSRDAMLITRDPQIVTAGVVATVWD